MTDPETMIWRIADATGAMERNFQRACGAWDIDAYLADWAVVDETVDMLRSIDRPAVHLVPRVVTGKGAPC